MILIRICCLRWMLGFSWTQTPFSWKIQSYFGKGGHSPCICTIKHVIEEHCIAFNWIVLGFNCSHLSQPLPLPQLRLTTALPRWMFCLVSDLVTSNVSKHLKGRWSFHPLWFGQAHPLPYFGPPGSGLNGGVALMNLTRSN